MTATEIPGYVVGNWTVDPVHSEIGFSVRHLMVSKVRGRFTRVEGSITTAENPLDSVVNVVIDLASITTHNEQRDAHLRSADFFNVDADPKMTFRSTGVRRTGESTFVVDGDLTIRGVTRPVSLDVEVNGFGPDPYGGTRAGFSATGEIDRHDFGVSWNAAIEGGGVVVGDKVRILLEIEAVLDAR
jgi:polyisoprenoid-binding protein YceI